MSKATKTQKPTFSLRFSEGGKSQSVEAASRSVVEKKLTDLFAKRIQTWVWMNGILVGAVWQESSQERAWNWFLDK